MERLWGFGSLRGGLAAGGGVARAVVPLVGWLQGRSSAGYGIGGWGGTRQFRQLHLIGNDTVFDIAERSDSELGVRVLEEPQRRVSGGGALLVIGVGGDVCGPGAISRRGVRRHELGALGRTKGFARHNGDRCTRGAEGVFPASGAWSGWRTRRTAPLRQDEGVHDLSCGVGGCLHCRIAAVAKGANTDWRLSSPLSRTSGLSGPADGTVCETPEPTRELEPQGGGGAVGLTPGGGGHRPGCRES